MFFNEFIVVEMRIGAADAVDLSCLTCGERFSGVEASYALEQSLAAQYFVNPGNAARKIICGIEERGVAVRYLCCMRQKRPGDLLFISMSFAFRK